MHPSASPNPFLPPSAYANPPLCGADGSKLGWRARIWRWSSTKSCRKYHLPSRASGRNTDITPPLAGLKPVIRLPPTSCGSSPGKAM